MSQKFFLRVRNSEACDVAKVFFADPQQRGVRRRKSFSEKLLLRVLKNPHSQVFVFSLRDELTKDFCEIQTFIVAEEF